MGLHKNSTHTTRAGHLLRIRRPGRSALASSLATTASLLGMLAFANLTAPSHAQDVALVRVDVALVGNGYRASQLIGRSVVNEKNETIGKLDDVIIAQDTKLYTTLQVGGFLGLGSRLVAMPYESLRISDGGRKIELPGASRDELRKLSEFRYLGS
jgi:sporulation protein YlmC with PRC-barrel domain